MLIFWDTGQLLGNGLILPGALSDRTRAARSLGQIFLCFWGSLWLLYLMPRGHEVFFHHWGEHRLLLGQDSSACSFQGVLPSASGSCLTHELWSGRDSADPCKSGSGGWLPLPHTHTPAPSTLSKFCLGFSGLPALYILRVQRETPEFPSPWVQQCSQQALWTPEHQPHLPASWRLLPRALLTRQQALWASCLQQHPQITQCAPSVPTCALTLYQWLPCPPRSLLLAWRLWLDLAQTLPELLAVKWVTTTPSSTNSEALFQVGPLGAGSPTSGLRTGTSCQISGSIEVQNKWKMLELSWTTPGAWENCLPRNQSLMPQKVGDCCFQTSSRTFLPSWQFTRLSWLILYMKLSPLKLLCGFWLWMDLDC